MSIALIYQAGSRSRLPVVQEMIRVAKNIPGLILAPMPTDLDQAKVYSILEALYRRGIRTYIGWEGSQVLEAGLPFIQSHPDIRAISIGSSSTTLALKDNIWRLSLPDMTFIEAMKAYIQTKGYKRILLLWDQGGAWATSMAKDIQASIKVPIIPIPFRTEPMNLQALVRTLEAIDAEGIIQPKDTLSILLLARDLEPFFQATRPFWNRGYPLIAGDGAEGFNFPGLEDVALATGFMVVHNQVPTTKTMLDLQAQGFEGTVTIANILDAHRLASAPNIQTHIMDGATGFVAFDANGDRLYGWVALSQFIPSHGYVPQWLLIKDPILGISFSKLIH